MGELVGHPEGIRIADYSQFQKELNLIQDRLKPIDPFLIRRDSRRIFERVRSFPEDIDDKLHKRVRAASVLSTTINLQKTASGIIYGILADNGWMAKQGEECETGSLGLEIAEGLIHLRGRGMNITGGMFDYLSSLPARGEDIILRGREAASLASRYIREGNGLNFTQWVYSQGVVQVFK